MLVAGCAHQEAHREVLLVQTSPKLEILDQQIKFNPKDAQAYSNRGYVLALLGRKAEARADLQRAVTLKDNAPMRNRVGWAFFNMGDYPEALREFEAAAKSSNFKAHYDYYSLVLGCWRYEAGAGELSTRGGTRSALRRIQDPQRAHQRMDAIGAPSDARDLRAVEQDVEAVRGIAPAFAFRRGSHPVGRGSVDSASVASVSGKNGAE